MLCVYVNFNGGGRDFLGVIEPFQALSQTKSGGSCVRVRHAFSHFNRLQETSYKYSFPNEKSKKLASTETISYHPTALFMLGCM